MKKIILIIISMFPYFLFSNEFFMTESVDQGAPITFLINPDEENIDYVFEVYSKSGVRVLTVKGFNYYLFDEKINVILGLGGIPCDLTAGEYKVKATGRGAYNTYFFERPLFVKEVIFPSSILKGNTAMDDIVNGVINQERVDQSQRLWATVSNFSQYILYHEGFLKFPVIGRFSSPYGYKRITKYPKGKDSVSIHYGEDLAVEKGTPVLSDGDGRIVLSEFRIVTGNTVVIEHLPGVMSMFYHMDSLNVERGDFVKQGDKIGEAGTTGYSTGPHVHWELKFSTVSINPIYFIDHPLIDKILIMNMINSTNNKRGG